MFKNKTPEEVAKKWAERRERMAQKRKDYEPIWDAGISLFLQGVFLRSGTDAERRAYDVAHEQYQGSLYSREGLKVKDFQFPLLHTIAIRALASEFKNRPVARFIPYGSNIQSKSEVFNHLFQQNLAEIDADLVDFDVLWDRRIRGTGAVLQLTEQYDLTVKDANLDGENKLKFNEKTKTVTNVTYRQIDLRHLFLDENCTMSNLSDCFYVIVDEFIGKEEAETRFKDKYGLTDKDLEPIPLPSTAQKSNSGVGENGGAVMKVHAQHCFDRRYDAYHLILNNKLVNDVNTPIPRIAGRKGKDLPIALAPMYRIPGSPYGYGDPAVVKSFNVIKDFARLVILESAAKTAKPTLAVAPETTFDAEGFTWGEDIVRVDPNAIRELKINPDYNALSSIEATADNDVIQTTGINVKDTTNADVQETARKTVIRRESQIAIIELGMMYISSSYFKRLYNLLKDDLRLYYGAALEQKEDVRVRTEGVKLSRTKTGIKKYNVTGFRYFDVKKEDIDFDTDLVLEIGNISTSKELEKALKIEALEKAIIAQAGFDQNGLAKYIQELGGMPESVLAVKPNQVDVKELATKDLGPEFLPQTVTAQKPEALQGVAPQDQAAQQEAQPQPPTV